MNPEIELEKKPSSYYSHQFNYRIRGIILPKVNRRKVSYSYSGRIDYLSYYYQNSINAIPRIDEA